MNLFSVTCLTCRRNLKVTDPGAIGEILACPGCGGMVHIAPPEGWRGPTDSPQGQGSIAAAAAGSLDALPKPIKPPPLKKPKPPAPSEHTYEQVDAAVAGVPPLAPKMVAAPEMAAVPKATVPDVPSAVDAAPGTANAIVPASPGAPWLSYVGLAGGALSVAVVSALIVAAIGSSSNPPADSSVVANAPPTPNINRLSETATEKSSKAEAKKESPAPPTSSSPPTSPAEKESAPQGESSRQADDVAKTPPPTPSHSKPSAGVSPDNRSESLATERPQSEGDKGSSTKESLVDESKLDLDDDLDAADRSPDFVLRPGVEPIDWPARLEDKISGVVCRQMPLADFVAMLSDVSNLRISLDVEAIAEAGANATTPITLSLGGTTLGAALEAGLKPIKLKVVPSGRHLQVVRDGENFAPLKSVPYTVHDLAPDRAALQALSQIIINLISPDSWKNNGGSGSIEITDRGFVVEQTSSNHFQIVLLCEKLRLARGLPTKSKLDASWLRLGTRSDSIRTKMSQPVTAVFLSQSPLPKILEYLGKSAKIRFLIDDRALEADGISPDVAGAFHAQNEPLEGPFAAMLKKMQLAYRVVDESTVQITTAKGFRREWELYDVKGLLATGATAEQIAGRVQAGVAPGRWIKQGGKGLLEFDPASGMLIVSHSQLVQREVAELLSRWRSEEAVAKKTPPEK